MNGSSTMSAAVGMGLAVLWSTGAMAQISQISQSAGMPAGLSEAKQVEGKVVDVEPARNMVAMLRLDNGLTLTLPNTRGGETLPKVGDEVMAHYVDNGADKVTTFLRVIETQAP
jgi:hypothetical protein